MTQPAGEGQKIYNQQISEEIKAFAPEVVDNQTPLSHSLVLDPNRVREKMKILKPAGKGLSGRVKYVRFKNDPVPDRFFAIKRPMNFVAKALGLNKNDIRANLNYYQKNVDVAVKIGNHPNFMKVHGVVVKERNGKEAKPYLILEYIEGTILRDLPSKSKEDTIMILTELKNALTHLHKLGIYPDDLNLGNYLITPDNHLKIIDYDAWQIGVYSSRELEKNLYETVRKVANLLEVKFPPFSNDLESSMDNLIDGLRPF